MIDRTYSGLLAIALGALLTACEVDVREGVFACGDDTECPSGWSCRKPSGRCHRAPEPIVDASHDDAGHDGGLTDGGTSDGGTIDAGWIETDGGPPDEDLDGVPDAIDCAPSDPRVGATATRDCARACGAGDEMCTDGVWGECDAPTTCLCADGATQTIPCGHCGMQAQECVGNAWIDVGTCSGAGECAPSTTEHDSEACLGGCGTMGTHSRTRTCSDACTWSSWSAFGPCVSCAPANDVGTQGCGNCGTQTRTRSCDTGTCTWGTWSGYGTCTGSGVCEPGDSQSDSCGSPTYCGTSRPGVHERFCTDSCTWGGWGFCDCS